MDLSKQPLHSPVWSADPNN